MTTPMVEEVERELDARTPWYDVRLDGLPVKAWIAIGIAIAAAVLGFGAWWTYGRSDGPTTGMGMTAPAAEAPRLPPVAGLYDGEPVTFVHTEASDPQVAGMLTDMMGSPVLVVPELAAVPEGALARVYVFTNGVRPEEAMGPFGFQVDVFDAIPGDPAYRPLRAVQLVTWQPGASMRVLGSVADIEQAAEGGEVRVERPGIVVNMPFLAWPGGSR